MSSSNRTAQAPALDRFDAPPRYPLSLGQSDVWMQVQLYPEGDVSKLSLLFGISGELEVPLAKAALQSLVERHEILRTTFAPGEDGSLEQRVLPEWTLDCAVFDCSSARADTPVEDRNRKVEVAKEHAREQQSLPFTLAIEPPLRARLLHYDQQWNCLVLTFHRLLLDGLHGAQLMGEWAQSYKRLKLAQESLPPPAVQYGEFARQQRSRLDAGLMEDNLNFWRGRLQEPLPNAVLPADFDAPHPRNAETTLHTHHLPVDFTAELRQAQKRLRATTIQIATAALVLLLHRIGGDREFLVALPVSTRPRTMGGTIGFFSNILPLRLEVRAGATGEDLVRSVSEQFRESLDRREFPWAEVLTQLRNRSSGAGQSLLPLSVSQIGVLSKRSAGGEGDLALVGIGGYGSSSSHDLSLIVQEQVRVSLRFSYARDLFAPEMIERWGRYLEAIILAFVRTPGLPVEQIDLEEHLPAPVLADPKPQSFSLRDCFLGQVSTRPEAIAVSCGSDTLTYRALNATANRWGRWLLQQGRRPGEPIAIDPDSGLHVVVAALAAWKAEMPYFFRKPHAGREDQWFDVSAARAGSDGFPEDDWLPRSAAPVYVDRADAFGDIAPLVDEGGAGRFTDTASPLVVHPEDRVLFSSTEPPAAACAMWGSLLNGARLVVALDGDAVTIGRSLGREAISMLSLSASEFALVAETVPDALDGVRMIVISGGPVPGKLLRHAAMRLRKCGIVYTYSPAGEWPALCSATVPAEGKAWRSMALTPSPSGPALTVREPNGLLAAAGIIGEIATAAPAGHLLATGDLGRLRGDGTLEFLGRLGSPLRVEGIWPSLSETERALRDQPEVQDVVVRLGQGVSKQARLVAYVAVAEPSLFPDKQVRGQLAMRLPSYLRPSVLVPLLAIPQLPDGTIDYAALPAPVATLREDYRAPRTPVEEEIANIWAGVLGVEQIGIDDNFFELGGHSIAVLAVYRQIRERLGMEFSLIAMFEHATIAHLTQHLTVAGQGAPALNTGLIGDRAAQQLRRRLDQAQRRKGAMA